MKCVVRKCEHITDWWTIERAEHDGREWTEEHIAESGMHYSAWCLSSRLEPRTDVEGTGREMLALAAAIEAGGSESFKRCAIETERIGGVWWRRTFAPRCRRTRRETICDRAPTQNGGLPVLVLGSSLICSVALTERRDEMAKYKVSGMMTISVNTVVEAKSARDAIKKAEGCDVMSLCWQCSEGTRGHPGEWRTSGELDGTPSDLEAVEEK